MINQMNQVAELAIHAAINDLDQPCSWEMFFELFLSSIHPAEFAIRDERADQLENAISSAAQISLRKTLYQLKHNNISTALETPTHIGQRRTVFADITLFPWLVDPHGQSQWHLANDKRHHINLEIKWKVQGSVGTGGLKALLNQNIDTKPFYTLVFFFHKDPSFGNCYSPGISDTQTVIYSGSKFRPQPELRYTNPFMTLIVIRSQWPNPSLNSAPTCTS